MARLGEVSEWPKERDWKSRTCRKVGRGFKSRPLRLIRCAPSVRSLHGGILGSPVSHLEAEGEGFEPSKDLRP
jgi:hypothetical protein